MYRIAFINGRDIYRGHDILTESNLGFVSNAIRLESHLVLQDVLIVNEQLTFDGDLLLRRDCLFELLDCVLVIDEEVRVRDDCSDPNDRYRNSSHRAVAVVRSRMSTMLYPYMTE